MKQRRPEDCLGWQRGSSNQTCKVRVPEQANPQAGKTTDTTTHGMETELDEPVSGPQSDVDTSVPEVSEAAAKSSSSSRGVAGKRSGGGVLNLTHVAHHDKPGAATVPATWRAERPAIFHLQHWVPDIRCLASREAQRYRRIVELSTMAHSLAVEVAERVLLRGKVCLGPLRRLSFLRKLTASLCVRRGQFCKRLVPNGHNCKP